MNSPFPDLTMLSSTGVGVMLDASLKGVFLLALGLIAVLLMRRTSSALRHFVCSLAIVSLLLLPVLSGVLPSWRILPHWKSSSLPASAQTPVFEVANAFRTSREFSSNSMSTKPTDTFADSQHADDYMSHWELVFLGVWATGFLLSCVPLGLGAMSLRKLECRVRTLSEGRWAEWLEELSREIGLRQRVKLLLGSQRTMPMVWGILHPKLFLPEHAVQWSEDRLRMVMVHELAHVKRMDCLTTLLTRLACAVYWYNPLVWVTAWRMRVERERACDDLVLQAGANGANYAEQLLELTSGYKASSWVPGNALAIIRKSTLEGRLLAIVDPQRNRRGLTRVSIFIGVALLATTMVPTAMLGGRPIEQKTPALAPSDTAGHLTTQTPGEQPEGRQGIKQLVQPVDESQAASSRGQPVGGLITMRLNAHSYLLKEGQMPTLLVDFKHVGNGTIDELAFLDENWAIEMDGHLYRTSRPDPGGAIKPTGFKPGTVLRNIPVPLQANLVSTDGSILMFLPGRHVVRVHFTHEVPGEQEQSPQAPIHLISNPIELDVVPYPLALLLGNKAYPERPWDERLGKDPDTRSKRIRELEELKRVFNAYMMACSEKDINAMTAVYDLEYIADKWGNSVGKDPDKIREQIRGIVANKRAEFYEMCDRVHENSDKVDGEWQLASSGEIEHVELKYEDWSWTFHKTPAGWKLNEEGRSAQAARTSEKTRQQNSVLCVAPQGQFNPQTESELLAELNSQLPFVIAPKHFISKRKSSGIVGWAVVENNQKKDVAKTKLKQSSTLRLLQVEALTPEFETLIKQDRLSRDLKSMIKLLESGAWNKMADQFVVASHVAEAKEGLKIEMNRQITLAVLKELATKNARFSQDSQYATFQIAGDEIPPHWRFEDVAGRWRIADTFWSPQSTSLFTDDLTGDAYKTYSAHANAIDEGTEKHGTEIPPTYWAVRIRALDPIRVYIHRINIVVVQRFSNGTEEGKYIYIPISSYLPQTGDDDFVFIPNPRSIDTHTLGKGVYDFKRTRSK